MANGEYKVKVGVEFNAIMKDINSAIGELQRKLKNLGSASGDKTFSGITDAFTQINEKLNKLRDTPITAGNVSKFQAELENIESLIDKTKNSLDNVNLDGINSKIDAQKDTIATLTDKLTSYKAEYADLEKLGDGRTEEQSKRFQELGEKITKTTRSISAHNGQVTKLERIQQESNNTLNQGKNTLNQYGNAVNAADNDLEKFIEDNQKLNNEKVAKSIQNQVNRYIGLAAVYRYTKKYIQDLIQTYKEFDESLVAIAAVTGQTRDQMWANIGVYNKMAQSLGTTTQEVINASKLYYQQGLTTTSVLKLTEETVKLATIAELDSADATEYLTTAMNGFKLSAEESTRVTDVWANLAAKTASDVDELAIAISKVASLAENAGMEIETASAFLNQMIETTREAPENLGTALKTIIARFQELKTSEEGLSDGVDANKVERALKSAGVALRDTTGQFRDFDDVILELSSKWDGLDRNTQRYIATIAAGSRQQSRFIALVSDYEGLLRNVNYAYDSLGSADAQMAVFQEGLAASTNRLKAAWEGLYTSWSESATVISKLIDGMAGFVSTLADLGAGTSAIIAGISLLTVTILTNATAMNVEAMKTTNASLSFTGYIAKAAEVTGSNIAIAASTATVVAGYVALLAILGLLLYGLIKVANYEKDYIKAIEATEQKTRQLAAQEKDRASSAGVLITELENVKNSEEGIEEVRQKIIDQFGDQIKGINLETASYEELINKLKEYQNEQNNLAAKDYISAAVTRQNLEALDKVEIGKKWQLTDLGDENHVYRSAEFVPVFKYNGKEYSSIDELKADNAEDFNFSNILNDNETHFIAKTIIDSEDIKNEVEISQGIIETFINGLDTKELTSLFDENGIINQETLDRINILNDEVIKLYNSLDAASKIDFANFLNGEYGLFNIQQLEAYIAKLREINPVFADTVQAAVIAYQTGIQNALQTLPQTYQTLLTNGFTLGGQKAFVDAWNNLANDPSAQAAFGNAVKNLIAGGMNPEDITSAMITSLGDVDLATDALSNLVDGLGNLKDPTLISYFQQLRNVIGESNAVFEEGKSVVDAYYSSMSDLADLQKGGMSNEDYLAKLYSEAAALAEVTDATYEQIVAEMLKATTLDESGQMILQQTDLLAQWAEQQYIASDQTVEAKKAELLAYAASMDAIADELEALADEAEGRVESGQISQESADAMIEAAVKTGIAENNMGAAAQKAWERLEGSKNTTPYAIVQQDLVTLTKKLNNVSSIEQIRGLANEARAKALTARAQAAQLSINKLANTFNKAGKAAGSAAKETDKYKDALKELNDQLKETKEEAEKYIDAVIDFLDEEAKAVQQEMDKEEAAFEKKRNLLKIQLQAWKDYIDKQQELAQGELELQGKAADMYFNQEIAAIQAKIDALDDEAEAEDRLLKLQKARDDYNKAQNNKTRLVLTKGAGWIFKTDQNEITNARKALNDVQREIQKADYQKQVEDLQAQAATWQEIANKIGESAEEAAKLEKALEDFTAAIGQEGGYADVNTYANAVKAQQEANDEYARLSAEVDEWLKQADWTAEDIADDNAYKAFIKEFENGTVGETELKTNVTNFLEKILTTQAFLDSQQQILDRIEEIKAFYNEQKSLIGLTNAQLKAAEEMRDAIKRSYDDSAENLGLGSESKYYKDNVLTLIEKAKDIAEQIAALEAEQAAAQTAAQNQSSGGSGSSGGGGSSGGSFGGGGGTTYNNSPSNLTSHNYTYNTVLDSIRNNDYGQLHNNSGVNAIRDSDSTNTFNNANYSNVNINSMYINANDIDEFTTSLRQKGLITNNTYGTR